MELGYIVPLNTDMGVENGVKMDSHSFFVDIKLIFFVSASLLPGITAISQL